MALGLVGSASLGLTMMACYGGPPCEPGHNGCRAPQGGNKDSNKDVSKDAKPDAGVKL